MKKRLQILAKMLAYIDVTIYLEIATLLCIIASFFISRHFILWEASATYPQVIVSLANTCLWLLVILAGVFLTIIVYCLFSFIFHRIQYAIEDIIKSYQFAKEDFENNKEDSI